MSFLQFRGTMDNCRIIELMDLFDKRMVYLQEVDGRRKQIKQWVSIGFEVPLPSSLDDTKQQMSDESDNPKTKKRRPSKLAAANLIQKLADKYSMGQDQFTSGSFQSLLSMLQMDLKSRVQTFEEVLMTDPFSEEDLVTKTLTAYTFESQVYPADVA